MWRKREVMIRGKSEMEEARTVQIELKVAGNSWCVSFAASDTVTLMPRCGRALGSGLKAVEIRWVQSRRKSHLCGKLCFLCESLSVRTSADAETLQKFPMHSNANHNGILMLRKCGAS